MSGSVVNIKVGMLRVGDDYRLPGSFDESQNRQNTLLEWLENPNNIYIGRNIHYVKGAIGSKWKNPFSVKKHGRDECVRLYEEYIHCKLESGELDISELIGKNLGCWCAPEQCHGHVLKIIVDQFISGEDSFMGQ
ncbi:MAG: DUF4326 domain-containing protein [Colwellia sp.]|nr:DUF4326 domain-containing protein [Colwellia sp.]